MNIKKSFGDKVFDICNIVFLTFLAFITIYPFWNIAAISFNEALDSLKGGISFWPRKYTLANYEEIFQNRYLAGAFINSVVRVIIQTSTQVICTMMLSYTVSRKDFVLRKFVTSIFIFTMYFSGGLIPGYFLIKNLHLTNTFLVYIVPGLVSAFNMIVARSFIEDLPYGVIEFAKIDGTGEFKIFLMIVLPMCLPVVVTLSLFTAVGAWNDWYTTFLFNPNKKNLTVLQYELMKIVQSVQTAAKERSMNPNNISEELEAVTPESIKAAMTIVATVPILFVYPFAQKYFVKGFSIGAVKE